MSDSYDKIIWSADVGDMAALVEHLDRMPRLRRIKIDRLFIDDNGWDIFNILHRRGLEVFDDAKIVEIPSKLEAIARVHINRARPWMLNCMAGSLSSLNYEPTISKDEQDGLRRFATACKDNGVIPCAVSVLTTKSAYAVMREFGGRPPLLQVEFYAEQILESGITHMVCSPKEVTRLRKSPLFADLRLVTPNVRPLGSSLNDQDADRSGTPADVIMNGSDYLVIGRPIHAGPGKPAENLDAIAVEIEPLLTQQDALATEP